MKIDIVRAWKDPLYRQSLSEEERQMLPENPVGALELTGAELETVSGGRGGSSWDWRCHRGSWDWRCHRSSWDWRCHRSSWDWRCHHKR